MISVSDFEERFHRQLRGTMPYRRNYRSYHKPTSQRVQRRYYGGIRANRRGIRTKYNWNQLQAGAALALNVLNSEKKHYDENNNQSPSTTGTVQSIIRGIAQGTTENQLVGNSLRLKRINYSGQVAMNASATETRLRWAIVLDKRPETSVPSYTTIYSAATLQSFLNIDDQPGRFVVLKQKRITLSGNSYAEHQWQGSIPVDFKIRFNDSQIPRMNDILMVVISDETTNTPSMVVNTRLRYYDN